MPKCLSFIYNEDMASEEERKESKKIRTTLMICLPLIIVSLIALTIFASTREYVVFDKVYARAFGSDHIKVHKNGRVYCDSETEEPDHKEDWHYVTTLDESQMEEFLGRASFSKDEEIREYIHENIGCIEGIYQ